MSIEDKQIDALFATAKLDSKDGPAPPLDQDGMHRELASLFGRRDAVLSTRRQWHAGIALGAVLIGAALVASTLREPAADNRVRTTAAEPSRVEPTMAAPPDHAVPPPPNEATPNMDIRTIDVASLPSVEVGAAPRPRGASVLTATPSRSEAESAEDLLRTANLLRADKNWADAARTYERVVETYERSGQAYPAMVAAATLRLERLGDPAGALRLYQRALTFRPTGALKEEAMFGEARAYRSLGRSNEERSALQRFLSSSPSSWRADPVRARLRELTHGTDGDGRGD